MLQSSFFGGPKGKDFIVKKIYPNAYELITAEAGISVNSELLPGDLVLISYGSITSTNYESNSNKDKTKLQNTYNAKVYQKKIGIINTSTLASQDILYKKVTGINGINEEAYFEFVIDLTTETLFGLTFDANGEPGSAYSLTTDNSAKNKYTLNIPAPEFTFTQGSIEKEGKQINTLKIGVKSNGISQETEAYELSSITNTEINNLIPNNSEIMSWTLEYKSTDDFITKINELIQNQLSNLTTNKWYLINCYCRQADTSNKYTNKGYVTIFLYINADRTFTYSLVQSSASEQSTNYGFLGTNGITLETNNFLQSSLDNNIKLQIKDGTLNFVSPSGNFALPGTLTKTVGELDKKYTDIITEVTKIGNTTYYYRPSEAEKILYDKIQEQKGTIDILENKVRSLTNNINSIKNTVILSDTDRLDFSSSDNSYDLIGTSSSKDIFIGTTDSYINEAYMKSTSNSGQTVETKKNNLYDCTNLFSDIIEQNTLKKYNTIKMKINYQTKTTTNMYLKCYFIEADEKNFIASKNALQTNGRGSFSINFEQLNNGQFQTINLQEFNNSLADKRYNSASLTAESYTSSTDYSSLTDPFVGTKIYLACSTSSYDGATQNASTSYYASFSKYFDWIQIQIIGEDPVEEE